MAALGAVGVLLWLFRPYQLPRDIKAQASFSVYVPPYDIRDMRLKPESVKLSQLDGDTSINFVMGTPDGDVTISQQAYPDALIYEKFTNSLNPDTDISTDLGKLYVGHPADAHGKQVAGMKVGDTLLLGQPTRDLTPERWRDLINTLELAK